MVSLDQVFLWTQSLIYSPLPSEQGSEQSYRPHLQTLPVQEGL